MAAPESTPPTLASLLAGRRRDGRGTPEPPSSLQAAPSPEGLRPSPPTAVSGARKPAPARERVKAPVADKVGQFGLLFNSPVEEIEPATPEPAPEPKRHLWTVAELVSVLRGRVEREYADVWVEGEISNCRPAPSGHLYFTLKGGDAQLPVVLFRREASLLRFKPQDGLAVLVRGRLSVYENRGQLQLIGETLEPRGAGALQLAFEQLKARLRDEGLFETERKRPLPAFPKTIGVITSTQGAVLRDIVTVSHRRHACLNILVFPATMQGPACAGDVIRGLQYFNRSAAHRVDVVLIARGGGSAEDLAGFNDEALARAIAASDLPVVSAVGHETDFTIADFVADLRAPTPSAAAEMITAAQHRVEEHVQHLSARLLRGMRFGQMLAQQRYARVAAAGAFARMRDSMGRRQQRVDHVRFRLDAAASMLVPSHMAQLRTLEGRLQRGDVRRSVVAAQHTNDRLRQRLQAAGGTLLRKPSETLGRAEARLQALSPHAVLQRGYALVFAADGKLLRSSAQVSEGDTITAHLREGTVQSRVLATSPQETGKA